MSKPRTGPCSKCGANDRTPGGCCRICTRYAYEKKKANTKPELHKEDQNLRAKKSYWNLSEEARKVRSRKTLCRRYGMTPEVYDAMLERQGGGCKICGTKTPSKGKSFHVDHCHRTGRVRGILCHHCNVAIGLLREDVDIVRKVLEYLEIHRPKRVA